MNHLSRVRIAASVLAVLAIIAVGRSADDATFTPVLINGHPAHPTRLLAKVKPVAKASAHAPVLAAQGLRTSGGYSLVPGLVVLDADPLVQAIAAASANITNAEIQLAQLYTRIDALRASGLFEYVEPDYVLSAAELPNDAALVDGTLWGLRNTGANGGVAGVDVNATRAWDVTTGSDDVIVAIIDSGIQYSHLDLAGQMWRNAREIPSNGIDDDGNGIVDDYFGVAYRFGIASGDPMDANGHGTHVAGTIGAAANDGHRHVGVAWHVQLMACRFLDELGQGTVSDAVSCIDYAVANGARILNNSWGGGSISRALSDAIAAADRANVLFVIAAGNGGRDGVGDDTDFGLDFPVVYEPPNVVAVAAIDRSGNLASFSNYGPVSVDLSAPGVSIFSSAFALDLGKDYYRLASGTSMATPHVSGVAALALARFPELNVAELKNLLLATTRSLPALAGRTVTGGMVDAYRAVTGVADARLEVHAYSINSALVYAGQQIPIHARVTDLHEVRDATVTGLGSDGNVLVFRNDGVAPDGTANDGEYSAWLHVPSAHSEMMIDLTATAPWKAAAATSIHFAIGQPPANDDFDAAAVLTGFFAHVTASNVGADSEPGEPSHGPQPGGASVWWSWTAPADCTVTIDTIGSEFRTLLAVYRGGSVTALTPVAQGGISIPGTSAVSEATFAATGGTTYWIAVDGLERAGGVIELTLMTTLVPPNDRFADRLTIAGHAAALFGTTANATVQPGEPPQINGMFGGSIWWTWTPTVEGTGILEFADALNVSESIGVYTGDTVATLQPVTNFDGGNMRFAFTVASGTTYQIVVYPSTARRRPFRLDVSMATPPANDMFANRAVISGTSFTVTTSNLGATREGLGTGAQFQDTSASLWWTWTAPDGGTAIVSASIPRQISGVRVFTGTVLGSLTEVWTPFDPNASSNPRQRVFRVQAGTTYQIMAGDGTGELTLTLDLVAPPPNDRFANRTPLTGRSVLVQGSNVGATVEPDEFGLAALWANTSVWWSWTAPATGRARVSNAGSSIKTIMGVATGPTYEGLFWLAEDSADRFNEADPARLSFDAVAGVAYNIVVHGYGGAMGNITLRVDLPNPVSNDRFADRIPVVGADVTMRGTNVGAGPDGVSAIFNEDATVWWSWTAPANGRIIFDTAGSDFDLRIYVFSGNAVGALVLLGQPDNDQSPRTVTAGTTYQIAVDGRNGQVGNITLRLTLVTPPGNDQFANRIPITGPSITVTGDNTAASDEPGEFDVFSDAGSIWWSWTASADGFVVADASQSSIATRVYVYTGGPELHQLQLAPLLGEPGLLGGERFQFSAVAGTSYHIAVSSRDDVFGAITLNLSQHSLPANDHHAQAVLVPGNLPALAGNNRGATIEPGEPWHTFTGAYSSVWWKWTAPTNAAVIVTTAGSDFDTQLAVYTGNAVSNLKLVAANDDARGATDYSSRVVFPAVAGTNYFIAVDGYYGAIGNVALSFLLGAAPQVAVHLNAPTIHAGETVVLNAIASGSGVLRYQWMQDGVDIPDANAATYRLPSVQAFHRGRLSVLVESEFGRSLSPAVEILPSEPPPSNARLTNLSTRAVALTGDNVLIPGFVVAGPGNKQLLIRAVGPTLGTLGVAGTLPDPRLTLKRWNGTAYEDIAINDNWGTNPNAAEIVAKSAELSAFPLAVGSADAALLVDLAPGQYSAVASGSGTQTGIAIVELYDADTNGGTARLINISNRGYVGTGDSIMIPGFVVSDEGPKTLLIRAVGPTLASFGVAGVLADPTLTIYRRVQGTEEVILTNDDWGVGPGAQRTRDVAAQIQAFALPEGSNDAAFVVTLNPGIYTVHARGANDTTGVALVEVYAVP